MAQEDRDDGHRPRRGRTRPHLRHRRGSDEDTVLITSAKKSRLADWRHRRNTYAALQLSRIPLFLAAVAVYGLLHNPILAAVIAVVSLPLPWIAVLLANDAGESPEKGQPKVYKPALVREERARQQAALAASSRSSALRSQSASRSLPPSSPRSGHRVIDADDTDSTSPDDNDPENHPR